MTWKIMPLTDQRYRAFFARADYGGVHNLLPDAAQRGREWPGHGFARLQAMNQILDRILIWRLQLINWNLIRLRSLFRLDANRGLEIITADRARAPDYNESA